MKIVAIILSCVSVIFALISIFMAVKNNNTLNKRFIITNAIFEYNVDIINGIVIGSLMSYDDIESYDRTLWRLWDWGYKHILPKDKYELIKGYINKNNINKTK